MKLTLAKVLARKYQVVLYLTLCPLWQGEPCKSYSTLCQNPNYEGSECEKYQHCIDGMGEVLPAPNGTMTAVATSK